MELNLIESQKITDITSALPNSWKQILKNYTEYINKPVIQNHPLIKKH